MNSILKIARAVFALLCIANAASSAHGAPYGANLNGANENPPNASTATGVAVVSLDTAAHRLIISVTASALTPPADTGSHIPFIASLHLNCCVNPPGATEDVTGTGLVPTFDTNGGTRTITIDTSAQPLPPGQLPSGTFTWLPSFVASHGGTPATAEAALASGLAAGQAYANITTTVFGAGEIRGFLVAATPSSVEVPTLTPRSLGFLAVALVAATAFVLVRAKW